MEMNEFKRGVGMLGIRARWNDGAPEPDPSPEPVNEPSPEPSPEGGFEIPEPYREKGWTKTLKSADDLWKKADGMVELVGKKALPPKFSDMTPNEINEYISKSRPEKPTDYSFPEGVTDEQKELIGGWLHEAGIDDYRASKLVEKYLGHTKTLQEDAFSKEGMENMLKESFGDKYKEVGGKTANFIKGNITEEDAKLIEQIPNKYLGVLYRFANKVLETHGVNEGGDRGGAGKTGGADVEARKKDIRTKIIDLSKRPHSADEKQKLVDELNGLYKVK